MGVPATVNCSPRMRVVSMRRPDACDWPLQWLIHEQRVCTFARCTRRAFDVASSGQNRSVGQQASGPDERPQVIVRAVANTHRQQCSAPQYEISWPSPRTHTRTHADASIGSISSISSFLITADRPRFLKNGCREN